MCLPRPHQAGSGTGSQIVGMTSFGLVQVMRFLMRRDTGWLGLTSNVMESLYASQLSKLCGLL